MAANAEFVAPDKRLNEVLGWVDSEVRAAQQIEPSIKSDTALGSCSPSLSVPIKHFICSAPA